MIKCTYYFNCEEPAVVFEVASRMQEPGEPECHCKKHFSQFRHQWHLDLSDGSAIRDEDEYRLDLLKHSL